MTPSATRPAITEVIGALTALVTAHPRWGFWNCLGRLQVDGHAWNHKRVYRVYRALRLHLRLVNGPEFLAAPLEAWADARGVALGFIQPGKPDQNAFIERFNRTYRSEVLDLHLLGSMTEVRQESTAWLTTYNQERPHDSLGGVPPLMFLPRATGTPESRYALSP